MRREGFIAKLTEIQQTVGELLGATSWPASTTNLRPTSIGLAGNTDQFASGAGKSGKQIERCVISSFQVAESIGFKGDFRQWEDLLRIGD